jgi:hypothetical protein
LFKKGISEGGLRGRELNGSLVIQGLRGMNMPTHSLGKLRHIRKLAEPQLPGLKKEFLNTTQWLRITESERGQDLILPLASKKSFLDGAPNRLALTIAQIRTGHWLYASYLKRTRKNRD